MQNKLTCTLQMITKLEVSAFCRLFLETPLVLASLHRMLQCQTMTVDTKQGN